MNCERENEQNSQRVKEVVDILNSSNPQIPDCYFQNEIVFVRNSPLDPPSKKEDEYYRQRIIWQLKHGRIFDLIKNMQRPTDIKSEDTNLNEIHHAANKLKRYPDKVVPNKLRSLHYRQDMDKWGQRKKPGWGKYGNLTRRQLVNSHTWQNALVRFINHELADAEREDKLPWQTTFIHRLFHPDLTLPDNLHPKK